MAEEGESYTTGDLVDRATYDFLDEPEVQINLEIIDRINYSKKDCIEAVETLKQRLRSTNVNVLKLSLNLLEMCVKNCNIKFHQYVNNSHFLDVLVKHLKNRRPKKSTILKKLPNPLGGTSQKKKESMVDIEEKILYLVQLWADTFMMYEDKFPCYMNMYRDLRKDSVKFPPRDPNEKFMMQLEGIESPIFDMCDDSALANATNGSYIKNEKYQTGGSKQAYSSSDFKKESRNRNGDSGGNHGSSSANSGEKKVYRTTYPKRQPRREQPRVEENEFEDDHSASASGSSLRNKINAEEIEILETCLAILKDVVINAESADDLKSETALDIVDTCRQIRRKIASLLKRNPRADPRDVEDLQIVFDFVTNHLRNYKEAFKSLEVGRYYQAQFDDTPSALRAMKGEQVGSSEGALGGGQSGDGGDNAADPDDFLSLPVNTEETKSEAKRKAKADKASQDGKLKEKLNAFKDRKVPKLSVGPGGNKSSEDVTGGAAGSGDAGALIDDLLGLDFEPAPQNGGGKGGQEEESKDQFATAPVRRGSGGDGGVGGGTKGGPGDDVVAGVAAADDDDDDDFFSSIANRKN